jgi:hypothetical protein
MNTIQIDKIMKKHYFTNKIYLGTFAIDKLPIEVKYPSCLIVNNQKSSEEGEHWIAIYFGKNKQAEFFDSFGNPPKRFGLDKYINKHSSRMTFNKIKLQSNYSLFCGYYCLLYLIYKCKGFSLNYFLNFFNKPIDNDRIFLNLIKRYK